MRSATPTASNRYKAAFEELTLQPEVYKSYLKKLGTTNDNGSSSSIADTSFQSKDFSLRIVTTESELVVTKDAIKNACESQRTNQTVRGNEL